MTFVTIHTEAKPNGHWDTHDNNFNMLKGLLLPFLDRALSALLDDLKDRGLLKEGYAADIAVFDPQDFRDRATYREPHQYPTGARTHVIVNGTLVVENATHTEALPGKVLRRDKAGAVS